jgi:hypothetical protein
MKTEVRYGTLNFFNAGFVAASMDLDARKFVEKPASRSIFLPFFTLIRALLTKPHPIK